MKKYSSEAWLAYYRQNNASLLDIPWDADYSLSSDERQAISKSLAEFQKGESSEGQHLITAAREHAAASGDSFYLETTSLFIKEEQRHARELRRYLDLRGIPVAESAWPDSVFRLLRRPGGVEVSICVLVTAEIIAQVYYPALQRATNDPVLIRLCEQIISDEMAHVAFQAERIADLRKSASKLRTKVSLFSQRILFFGTVFVVWIQHKSVFIQAGFRFSDYWNDCWKYYRLSGAQASAANGFESGRTDVCGEPSLPEI